jgi:septum formation protein
MSKLILASGSAARQRMLRDAGVVFDVAKANIDEHELLQSMRTEQMSARDCADLLSELKSLKISRMCPDDWIIGADQTLSIGAEVLEQPGTIEKARAQLMWLRGKTHVLNSAVCVARHGSVVWRHVGQARLGMREFSDAFLERYLVEAGVDILRSVGAYHVEGPGLQLFSKIEGDLFTIQGMPMLPLLDYLRTQGLIAA